MKERSKTLQGDDSKTKREALDLEVKQYQKNNILNKEYYKKYRVKKDNKNQFSGKMKFYEKEIEKEICVLTGSWLREIVIDN